ncbi:hypothetical protein P3102_16895 [Amycolatopsis sp. QT-25]|uniref:hypothetical protein n=1 Tax=Amycolatopsis sp. QT-25 TaxID=3034022 RepID=UPI0023ED9769|nr:hypothetical protein [Amycolatopsis sp. QT-25]WET82764.1 hypothetical protein P3102_16895 [Amycolatopsis sp. QT-25]
MRKLSLTDEKAQVNGSIDLSHVAFASIVHGFPSSVDHERNRTIGEPPRATPRVSWVSRIRVVRCAANLSSGAGDRLNSPAPWWSTCHQQWQPSSSVRTARSIA